MATVEVQSATNALSEENVPVTETNKETAEEATKEKEVVSGVESTGADEVKVKEDAEEAAKPVVEEENIEEKLVEEKPVTEVTGEDLEENKKLPEVEQEVVAETTSEKEEEKEEEKKEEKAEEKPVVVAEEEVKKDEAKDEGGKTTEE